MEPIRVLHILHSMNRGGAENAIMNYYRNIDREKIQFDYLLTAQSKCQFEDEIQSMGGRVFRVPRLTISNPLPYLRGVFRFLRSHPEYKIVHSHTSSKSVFPLWVAKRVGVPIRICHSHGSKSESGSLGRIRDFLKPILKRVATHFLACGHDAALWLYGEDMIRKGKVVYFPNVIETRRFDYDLNIRKETRLALGIQDETTVLGCTARFSDVKNHLFLISLFNEFHKVNDNSLLLLVGDGEMKSRIEERVKLYQLQDSVIFAGLVPDVERYEQAMDFFLLTSFNEGIPLSLIEAQVSGLRCFVSNGVPEEADKTGMVSFLPLKLGAVYWANSIAKEIGYRRLSRIEDIISAGYDANTSSSVLERFYLGFYGIING